MPRRRQDCERMRDILTRNLQPHELVPVLASCLLFSSMLCLVFVASARVLLLRRRPASHARVPDFLMISSVSRSLSQKPLEKRLGGCLEAFARRAAHPWVEARGFSCKPSTLPQPPGPNIQLNPEPYTPNIKPSYCASPMQSKAAAAAGAARSSALRSRPRGLPVGVWGLRFRVYSVHGFRVYSFKVCCIQAFRV